MRLLTCEIGKIWRKRVLILAFCLLAFANIIMLWASAAASSQESAPQAYKDIQKDLAPLSMEEKSEFVQNRLATITAVLQIEQYRKMRAQGRDLAKEGLLDHYNELVQEYSDAYINRDYTLYTGNESTELSFLDLIQREMQAVEDYEGFLAGIMQQAQLLTQISIFSTDSFDSASIELTAQAYEGLSAVQINYAPQKGLVTALNFVYTDLMVLFFIFLLASTVVREEKENGLLLLIYSTPGGRGKTAVAKIAAMAFFTALAVVILYCINLVYCGATYGLGPLGRSIQSVPALTRCTLKVSVWQYLFYFLLVKYAAAITVALWVLLACFCCKTVPRACAAALALPGLQMLIRLFIPATSSWNMVKYANWVSFSRTNEFLGDYRNLYFFHHPVPLYTVEAVMALVSVIGLVLLFYNAFSCGRYGQFPVVGRNTAKKAAFFPGRKGAGLVRHEAYKILVLCGVAAGLLLLAIFQLGLALYTKSGFTPKDLYYQYYMTALSGAKTSEKEQWLEKEWELFQDIITLQEQYERGEISAHEYTTGLEQTYALQTKFEVFLKVTQEIMPEVEQIPQAQLVYEAGYERLFDFGGQKAVTDTVLAGLLCAFCFTGIFSIEKSTGMFALLRTTPGGCGTTVKRKLAIAFIVGGVGGLLLAFARIFVVLRDYGLPALTAPAMSLAEFRWLSPTIPLWLIVLLFFVGRSFACCCLAAIAMALSHKTGSMLPSVLLCGLLFVLPAVLAACGFEALKWFSVYPLLSLPAMCASWQTLLAALAYIVGGIAAIVLSVSYLFRSYGERGQGFVPKGAKSAALRRA